MRRRINIKTGEIKNKGLTGGLTFSDRNNINENAVNEEKEASLIKEDDDINRDI
jgi:hypothetical protein